MATTVTVAITKKLMGQKMMFKTLAATFSIVSLLTVVAGRQEILGTPYLIPRHSRSSCSSRSFFALNHFHVINTSLNQFVAIHGKEL
jgi:hypothetical protein